MKAVIAPDEKTRDYGYCAPQIHKNFVLVFGNQPALTIKAESEMVSELAYAFENKFDNDDLTLRFPDVFKEITSRDNNEKMELVVSNTLQPLNLIFSDKLVTKANTIAYIFVNTECNGVAYEGFEKKSICASELFRNIFEFDEVQLFTDCSKKKIVDKIDDLKKLAIEF